MPKSQKIKNCEQERRNKPAPKDHEAGKKPSNKCQERNIYEKQTIASRSLLVWGNLAKVESFRVRKSRQHICISTGFENRAILTTQYKHLYLK